MKEFFHGLRRKAGMVALGLACVVMGMWIRSNFIADFIVWPAVNRTALFVSAECKLIWETDYNSEEVAGYSVWNATTFMSVATADEGDE